MSMRPETWLEDIFGSPPQVRLLRVLARDPSKSWTEREAAAEAGLPPSTANVAFRRLHETGLLELRRAGRSHLVRLHTDYEVARRVLDILDAEHKTLDRALEAAAKAMPRGVALYLFGSTARDESTTKSDIDLLVVAPDAEIAEQAAARAHAALDRVLPAKVEIIALDRKTARASRYRKLLSNVSTEGRRLSQVTIAAVLR